MAIIGSASLNVTPSFDGFQGKLEGGTGKALTAAGVSGGSKFGDSAGRSASGKFSEHIKKAGKVAAIGLAGAAAVAFKIGADAIQGASDLAESTNKVQQIFGEGSERIFKFAEKAADKFGQTNQQARDAAATFGIFGRVAKLSGRENAKFAVTMDKLASDLASFHNTSPEQAIEAIGAAMRGEAEPIRKYGVLLDEASLKAEALAMGILKPVKDEAKIKSYQVAILEGQQKYNEAVAEYGAKSVEALKAEAALGTSRDRLQKATEGTIPPLTAQQKVLAAQSSIMKQTKVAQGDFARTSDGLANSQRRLTARWEDAKAKLGEALLPTVNKFVKFLNDKGIPAVEKFADWFNKDGVKRLGEFGDKVKSVAGHAKDLAKFLNDLPAPAKIAGLTTLFAGAAKLRAGKGGVLGTVGSLISKAKPLPVFVVNQGFGPPGPGGPAGTRPGVPPVIAPNGAPKLGTRLTAGLRSFLPILPAAGAYGNDQLPKLMKPEEVYKWERTAKANLDNVANAAEKVERQLGDTKNAGQKLVDTLFEIDRADPKVTYTAPGFDTLLRNTQQYKSLLDGLNGRTVTTFVRQTTNNNDTGEGGGGTVPGRSPREGVNFDFRGSTIQAHDYQDFMTQAQRRERGAALDGVR